MHMSIVFTTCIFSMLFVSKVLIVVYVDTGGLSFVNFKFKNCKTTKFCFFLKRLYKTAFNIIVNCSFVYDNRIAKLGQHINVMHLNGPVF